MCHKNKLLRSGVIKIIGTTREKRMSPQDIKNPSQLEKDQARARRCFRKHGFFPQDISKKLSWHKHRK